MLCKFVRSKENKGDDANQEHFNCESGTKFYSKTTVQSGQVSCRYLFIFSTTYYCLAMTRVPLNESGHVLMVCYVNIVLHVPR